MFVVTKCCLKLFFGKSELIFEFNGYFFVLIALNDFYCIYPNV